MILEVWKNLGLMVGLATLLLAGCSDRVAGGGSSGTETGNALTATIILADGTPAAHAFIYLRQDSFVAGDTSPTRFTTQTSDSGTLRIESIPAGSYSLEAIKNGYASLVHIVIAKDSNLSVGMDTLQVAASIVGHVPTPVKPGTRIVIPGTIHSAIPNDSGAFEFDTIPPGVFTVQTNTADSTEVSYVQTRANTQTSAGTLRSTNSSEILLDDFEDGDSQNRLGPIVGEGWWWLASSPEISVQQSMPGEAIPIVNVGGVHGNVVHFSFTTDSAMTDPWVDFGVQLGIKNAAYNMSCADSLIFWARGKAQFVVALQYPDSLQNFYPYRPSYSLSVNSSWTRTAVPMDSLRSADGLYPKNYLHLVTGISWVFTNTADFWIDDVSISGCSRAEIWGF